MQMFIRKQICRQSIIQVTEFLRKKKNCFQDIGTRNQR